MNVELSVSAEEWARCLAKLDGEPYFTPSYHVLHEANGDGAVQCSVVSEGDRMLLVPGIRTPIEDGTADLQTPNGYGGPLATANADAGFLAEAWQAWREQAARTGLIAAFFRLHPLLGTERWLPVDAEVRDERETIVVDLTGGSEAVRARMSATTRRKARRAGDRGASVRWNQPDDWPTFERLYAAAMERLGAPPSLRFTSAYMAALRALPSAELAVACTASGEVEAASVFLWGPRWGHYHLNARTAASDPAISPFLMTAGFDRAIARGLEAVHLGGGTGARDDDPLLFFKRGFGGRPLRFRVARVICDGPGFAQAIARWRMQSGREPRWLLGYREPIV